MKLAALSLNCSHYKPAFTEKGESRSKQKLFVMYSFHGRCSPEKKPNATSQVACIGTNWGAHYKAPTLRFYFNSSWLCLAILHLTQVISNKTPLFSRNFGWDFRFGRKSLILGRIVISFNKPSNLL